MIHERASVLRYTYIVCLVKSSFVNAQITIAKIGNICLEKKNRNINSSADHCVWNLFLQQIINKFTNSSSVRRIQRFRTVSRTSATGQDSQPPSLASLFKTFSSHSFIFFRFSFAFQGAFLASLLANSPHAFLFNHTWAACLNHPNLLDIIIIIIIIIIKSWEDFEI